MPEESIPIPRSKVLDILAWIGVVLVWALFLLAMALWEVVGWFRGYSGRRRRRRLAFFLPLLAFSTLAWKVGPVLLARFILLDKAAIAARWSEGLEPTQVAANLHTEALRLRLFDIQRQDGAIEVEKIEEEGIRRCQVRLRFTQKVRLFRWTWAVPIRGIVDESINPKPIKAFGDENLVR